MLNSKSQLQLNYACVWVTLSGGSTYKTMTEFLPTMNVPPLPFPLYHPLEGELANDWQKTLWKTLEEQNQALLNNQCDSEGIPWITVYFDGG